VMEELRYSTVKMFRQKARPKERFGWAL